MPRPRRPAQSIACEFCGGDIRKPAAKSHADHEARRFCSNGCHGAWMASAAATARVRAWLRSELARKLQPIVIPARPKVARPGFGRTPLPLDPDRGAMRPPDEEPEYDVTTEVAEL